MNVIRKLLLQHRSEVQAQMVAARAKVAEPFERELRAVNIALAALDGAPLIEAEPDESSPATPEVERLDHDALRRNRLSVES
jgi:hypothetical protein